VRPGVRLATRAMFLEAHVRKKRDIFATTDARASSTTVGRSGVLTGEFWTTVVVIVATLIAAAVADNFDAPRAWWIVGVVASAYVVSRGLAKAGTSHLRGRDSR
jgi:hypothetical protein